MSFKDKIGFHKKWHAGAQDSRPKIKYSINEPIIQYIFNTLNIKQGFFLEFGAWDGINLSNARLLFENNWNGMFIEGDKAKFEDLRNNYSNTIKPLLKWGIDYCLHIKIVFLLKKSIFICLMFQIT